MDSTMHPLPEHGDLPWPEKPSSISGDHEGEVMIKDHSPWMGQATTTQLHEGHISPVSTATGMEIPGLDATGSTSASDASAGLATSASSADTWGSSFDADGDKDIDQDVYWDQPDEPLLIPKIEPVDEDDFHMDDVIPAPQSVIEPNPEPSSPTAAPEQQLPPPKVKRPRGRPRKHPYPPIVNANKVTKGRSKTGCITCRKRKKKCDEAKPRCMNCEKNAVVCEGYHEKQLWKSGRERAEENRIRRDSLPTITMQPLFHGLETVEDRVFWKHYCDHLSTVLTVEGEAKNAFKDIVVPLATKHKGLMHSILALAGRHIDYETPYGAKLLSDSDSSTTREKLDARAGYHHQAALDAVYGDKAPTTMTNDATDEEEQRVALNGSYGQILFFLLQTMSDGNGSGAHRIHLYGYQKLMSTCPPTDPTFNAFVSEFFQYHIYADELLRPHHSPPSSNHSYTPPSHNHPPRLMGVTDGLFSHLPQISRIRQTIRHNMTIRVDPAVDYTCLYQAAEMDAAIQEWSPCWPPGDGRDKVALLYKQTLWIYLFQTIHPPSGSSSRASGVPTPLTAYSRRSHRSHHDDMHPPMVPSSSTRSTHSTDSSPNLPATFSSMTVNSTQQIPPPMSPVHSTPSSSHHSPELRPVSSSSAASHHSSIQILGNPTPVHTPSSQTASATGNSTPSMLPQALSNRAESKSPPPMRVPVVDSRLSHALNSSLDILDSFKPSDPCQTLLLIPCLLLGTVCFQVNQRERVMQALKAVRGYTGLKNCDRVFELLERVWGRMAVGDVQGVWDWQGLAGEQGDFLCA